VCVADVEGCGGFDVFVPHPEHERLTLFGDGEPSFVIVECRARIRRRDDDARAAMTSRRLPRREQSVPPPRDDGVATLSLVVHYYGPVDDPHFVKHYVAQRPPMLRRRLA